MALIQFEAQLDTRTSVRAYYIFRGGKDWSSDRVGDLYLRKDEVVGKPPATVTVRVEWDAER